jgi:hypothetical protein
VCLSLDVLEHLAPFVVHPARAWRGETLDLEESEELMHRGRPWAGPAADRVADTNRIVEIPAE